MTNQTKIEFNIKIDGFCGKIGEYLAKVGVLGSDAAQSHDVGGKTTVTNSDVAYTHEFGSFNGFGRGIRIPRRSFLVDPVEMHKKEIKDQASKSTDIKADIEAENYKNAVGKLGAIALSFVLQSFENECWGTWEQLSPITLKKRKEKGYSSLAILIVTGQLRRAVTLEVVKKSDIL